MLKSEEAFPMIPVPAALESFNRKRKFEEDDDQQFDHLPSSKHHHQQLRDTADQSPTNTDHFFFTGGGGGDSDATAASLHVHVGGEGGSREEGSYGDSSTINGVSDQEEELDTQLTNYSQNFEGGGGGNPEDLMEDALLCYGLSYTDLLNLEPDHHQQQQQLVEKAMDEDEEDLSSPFTIILSERSWGIKQRDADAPPAPTIDQEFEQYFSKLMLQD